MKVSVLMITYNQQKFISQAIESVLMQETDFDFELVIGEDCSTDGTREIATEYQEKYPKIIRLLLPERNMGMMKNFIRTFKACSGQYIAILEGDDYWTSHEKLQKQVDFLDANPNFTISSHNVLVKYEDVSNPNVEWLGHEHKEVITLEDLLRAGSGGATCSLMLRRDALYDFPDWYGQMPGGDWTLQILCACHGKMRYFKEPMGVYRRHDDGLSSIKRGVQYEIYIYHNGGVKICEALNKHFDYRYDELLRKNLADYFYWNLLLIYDRNHDIISSKGYAWKILLELFPDNSLPPERLQKLLGVLGSPFIENNQEKSAQKISDYIRNASINWEGAYDFIKNIEKRQLLVGVEVGPIFSGLSEAFLKNTHIKHLYAIDPLRSRHSEFEDLYSFSSKQLSEFGDRYVYISNISIQESDDIPEEIDFVFFHIGDSYDSLINQLGAWFLKIRQGGIICGQNYDNPDFPGIKQAVDDFFANTDFLVNIDGKGMWYVEKQVSSNKFKLHIGCGPRVLKDWINIDLHYEPWENYMQYYTEEFYGPNVRGTKDDFLACDVTKSPLPFADNSVDVIFNEDFIEHLDQKEIILFLAETFRVLKTGGINRVSTPDLEWLMQSYSDFNSGYTGVWQKAWDWQHKDLLARRYLEELANMVGYQVIFQKRDVSLSPDIPKEYRPDRKDSPDKGHIFADLVKPNKVIDPISKTIKSPLTNSSNVILENKIDSNFITDNYKKHLNIDVRKYFEGLDTVSIYKCCDTGFRFYHPFHLEGPEDFYKELEKIPWYYMDWKWEHQIAYELVKPTDKVLEIGCARGGFLEKLQQEGIECIGLELNESAIETAQSKILNIFKQSIQDHAKKHPVEYDIVCFFQVLEHIAACREFIQASIDALRPGGKMIVSVPNNDSFIFKSDKEQILNRPPHHMGLWDMKSLISLTKIFNLTLDGIELEPLQSYHVELGETIVKRKLVQYHGEMGEKLITNSGPIISTIAKLILEDIPGHTILAYYTKA